MHTLTRRSIQLVVASLALCGLAHGEPGPATHATPPEYRLAQRWRIGGPGGWDYLTLDAAHHRLFVTRGDHVDVVDTVSGAVTGRIAGTAGVHGVVLAADLGRGYTSNGKANSITEFDLDTLAVLRDVPIPGAGPDAMVYEGLGHHLYVFNGKSIDALILDARTLAVVKRLPMPGTPEFGADDGHGHVYLNIESEPGQLVRIDTTRLEIDAIWALTDCASPTGLALDPEHARVFSTCTNHTLAVTDAGDGHAVARVAIGDGPDAAAFDPATAVVLSSNRGGTLSIIHALSADRYRAGPEVETQKGARTMAYDAATRRVYLVTAEFGPLPAPTAEQPRPRAPSLPDTFTVLVVEPSGPSLPGQR